MYGRRVFVAFVQRRFNNIFLGNNPHFNIKLPAFLNLYHAASKREITLTARAILCQDHPP